MGGASSTLEERRMEEKKRSLELFVKELNGGPDLRVSKSITMFSSVASSQNLEEHYEKRKVEAGYPTADWIKSLVQVLGDLTPSPALAGLGALAISVLIDIVSSSPPEESTQDALRSVFAEDKASEVWDQIDECLKRCVMHINDKKKFRCCIKSKDKKKLRDEIIRMESKLSAALTKLKNSMVRDGHMSPQALKAWVNGAAFHIQMLIHLVRLGGVQTCDPVERLLSVYLSDLDPLFKKHKEVIKGKCSTREGFTDMAEYTHLVDEESNSHVMEPHVSFGTYFEAYYEHRYNRQKAEIQQHFEDVRQNLQELVHQTGSFNVN